MDDPFYQIQNVFRIFNDGGTDNVESYAINSSAEIIVNIYLMKGNHHFIYCINEDEVAAFTPLSEDYDNNKWMATVCVPIDADTCSDADDSSTCDYPDHYDIVNSGARNYPSGIDTVKYYI